MPIHRRHLPKFSHYCFNCLKTTDHYADNQNMAAYCGACDREVQLREPIKRHVDVRGGYRPFEDRLQSALMVVENIYGYRTLPSTSIEERIDMLIGLVEGYYVDWDINSDTFQDLARQIYGDEIPKSPSEWRYELARSKNDPKLISKLVEYTWEGPPKEAPEPETPQGWGSVGPAGKPAKKQPWMSPGIIHMKRGTVIPADHIIEYSGPGNYKYPTHGKPVNVVLAGIDYEPTIFSQKWMTPQRADKRLARRSNLYERKPTKYQHWIESKKLFKQILTMLPHNVAKIDYT